MQSEGYSSSVDYSDLFTMLDAEGLNRLIGLDSSTETQIHPSNPNAAGSKRRPGHRKGVLGRNLKKSDSVGWEYQNMVP